MEQKGFLPCNGAELFYETAGSGEPLVLIHGAPLDSRMWEPQMKVLSERYQVVRFDMRGMGQSIDPGIPFTLYDDLHVLLRQLNIERASLIGASFGSYVGVEFALAYPDMVKSLVLICPGGFAPASEDRQQKHRQLQEQMDLGHLDEALELNLHLLLDGPEQQKGRVRLNRSWLKEIYRDIFQSSSSSTRPNWLKPDPRKRLAEVAAPTLVISGRLDHPDFLQTARMIASTIPDAQQLFCENSAHFPSVDSPDVLNAAIVRFLYQKGEQH